MLQKYAGTQHTQFNRKQIKTFTVSDVLHDIVHVHVHHGTCITTLIHLISECQMNQRKRRIFNVHLNI